MAYMQINNAKEYKLVWKITELIESIENIKPGTIPWEDMDDCYLAISEYNYGKAQIKSHGVKK